MTAWIVCCMHFKDPTMDTKSKIRQLVTCVSAMALLYIWVPGWLRAGRATGNTSTSNTGMSDARSRTSASAAAFRSRLRALLLAELPSLGVPLCPLALLAGVVGFEPAHVQITPVKRCERVHCHAPRAKALAALSLVRGWPSVASEP